MDFKSMLSIAQAYYETNNYDAISEKCLELIGLAKAEDADSNKEILKGAYLLLSKATIRHCAAEAGILIDAAIDTACKSLEWTSFYAQSLEEVFSTEREIMTLINDCERNCLLHKITEFESKATLDSWPKVLSIAADYAAARIKFIMALRGVDNVAEMAEAEGITMDEANAKYSVEPDNEFTDKERNSIYVASAGKILAKASADFENSCSGTTSNAILLSIAVPLQQIFVAKNMYIACLPNNDNEYTEEHLDALMGLFNVLNFILSAKIFTTGGRLSLSRGDDRQKVVAEYNKAGQNIKKLNPDFVVPYPPGELFQTNTPQKTSSSGGGGCYVATAVYGSYDCPQVWTLRRYRDNTLAQTWYGRMFVHTYYAISPTLVKWFGHTQWFKKLWKTKLDKMVTDLQAKGFASTPYEDKNW